MKNRKNIFAALAACVAMVFASCSNLTDANVSSTTENKNLLNVEITNYDDILTDVSLQANTGSRTIIPDSFDSTGVDFYIFGTNIGGGTLAPTKVTFTDGANSKVGTVDIPADSNIWDFTLVAVETDDPATDKPTALTNAVLIGYDTVDMINGDVAKFTLAPDGLTKAGSVAMKLYTDGWDLPDGYYAKAGIYLLTTGADATKAGDGSGDATETTYQAGNALPTAAPGADFTVDSMTPGTYLFKVTITNDTKSFYWSDVIVVLPGKTIDNTIAIPNIIGEKPDAPSDFTAGFVSDTEDKYNGIYITEFEWTRAVKKNERYFEIDLLELADATDALPAADDAWTTAAGETGAVSTTYGMNFAESEVYESGSILASNTTVQVKLALGKRYAARIRAVNDAGASANTYVTVGSTSSTTNGTAFTSTVINRYRIKYYLNGGTLYPSADDVTNKTNGKTTNVVVYDCESATTGVPILNGTVAPNIIKKGDYTWSYWSVDATTANKYPSTTPPAPDAYKGYKNLDLYAIFTTNAQVEIFDKASLKILAGWITMDSTPLTGNTATKDYADVTGDKIDWVITPADIKAPDGTTTIEKFAYDSVTFTVSKSGTTYYADTKTAVGYGSGAGAGTAGTFELPVSSLAAGPGVYQVMFTASYKSTTVSFPVTFTYTK